MIATELYLQSSWSIVFILCFIIWVTATAVHQYRATREETHEQPWTFVGRKNVQSH